MTSDQFIYWLHGFMDSIEYLKPISVEQSNIIRKKLKEVNRTYNNHMLTETSINNVFNLNKSTTSTSYDTFEDKSQLKLKL